MIAEPFFQRLFLLSGSATVLQTLVGHRYPIQEGPSTALLLTLCSGPS